MAREARGRAGRGPPAVLDPRARMWRQAAITGSQGRCPPVRLPEGPESSLLLTGLLLLSCYSAAPRPVSTAGGSDGRSRALKAPDAATLPLAIRTWASTWAALGPPESKPGRWVPGRPAAQSPGPRQGAGRPSCGQAGLHSPVKENRHPLHGHDHGLAVGDGRAGLGGSAWTDFLLSWNRAIL